MKDAVRHKGRVEEDDYDKFIKKNLCLRTLCYSMLDHKGSKLIKKD
jgi:hypothetical protein